MSGKLKVHMINFVLFTKLDEKKGYQLAVFVKQLLWKEVFFSEWRQDGTISLRAIVRTDSLSSKACQSDCNNTTLRKVVALVLL